MTGLPSWSEAFVGEDLARVAALPVPDARRWALEGATGAGVRVAILDSGVDPTHPAVGEVAGSVVVEADPGSPGGYRVEDTAPEDLVGHGTACAAIVRALAPEAELHSVRVLGPNLRGRGLLLAGGIEWAVQQGYQVANLSLSSKSDALFAGLHEVADAAYFARTLLVCAANNQPGPTYPSQFASVVSVAAMPTTDPWGLAYNPRPPVEFGARGIDVEVAWSGGSSIVATGNSFAAPHVTGMVAALLGKHPHLTPFQVKAVLQLLCSNSVATDPSPAGSAGVPG